MIDSHFHLDESIITVPGLLASMDAAGIKKLALIATPCPPLKLPWHADLAIPLIRAAIHRPAGFLHRRALAIYKGTVNPDYTVNLLGKEYQLLVQPDNDAVVKVLRDVPHRFFGYAFVNPDGPLDPLDEIRRCMGHPRMIGVKAHPFWHNYPMERLMNVAELCEEKNWPMLIHLGTGDHGDFELLPRTFRRLKVIYAHGGIPYSHQVSSFARENGNVYVDLSSATYINLKTAKRIIQAAGVEKCLFGTDGPYFHVEGGRYDFGLFLSLLDGLGLNQGDRERVAGRNFEELFGVS